MTTIDHKTFPPAVNYDFEVQSLVGVISSDGKRPVLPIPWWHNLKYAAVGFLFGIILVKSEVISWFRIQEMFRLERFHMYGVIGSAVVTGAISVGIIKKFNVKTVSGDPIVLFPIKFNKGQVYGGLLFGVGWALTGACPGPLFAQIGTGATVIIVTLSSAIAGTWVYGSLRDRLPH